ncbi:MAG: glutamate 5-kinase [Chthoniobacterales bacterium]|nr:glutamate 5-kinase [Chthoniobacterales bacterium]
MNSSSCIVFKFGTGVLATPGGCAIEHKQIRRIAAEIAAIMKQGISCIMVSSGAIAAGVHTLGLDARPADQAGKQACAAVGQPALMEAYAKYFSRHGITTAQLLLTHEDIYTEQRRHNAQATLRRLLASPHVLPIINENDSVAVEELKLGDNDELSAEVAIMMKARLLILVTSSDGLRAKTKKSSKRIPSVSDLAEVLHHVTQEKGEHSTGGMTTKLQAVAAATASGIETVIVHGRKPKQITKALAGNDVGTRFLSCVAAQE